MGNSLGDEFRNKLHGYEKARDDFDAAIDAISAEIEQFRREGFELEERVYRELISQVNEARMGNNKCVYQVVGKPNPPGRTAKSPRYEVANTIKVAAVPVAPVSTVCEQWPYYEIQVKLGILNTLTTRITDETGRFVSLALGEDVYPALKGLSDRIAFRLDMYAS